MTQSPGRDSPGSSGSGSGSRHSTASLDSGRASGYHLGPRGPGALASSPRCSISSLGSHPDRPADLDVVHAWLTELQFEEYFPLFASAGYDLATITRMTPEDLTAIGSTYHISESNLSIKCIYLIHRYYSRVYGIRHLNRYINFTYIILVSVIILQVSRNLITGND